MKLCLSSVLAFFVAAALPTHHFAAAAKPFNISVYHVNPQNYSGITNMDTADAAGDAFFDLRSVMLPMSCRNKSARHWGNECSNPEQVSPDLVVTRVVVEVRKEFNDSGYARCNVCINGSDPMAWPRRSCTSGNYICDCGGFGPDATPCDKAIGREAPGNLFGRFIPKPSDPAPDFWTHNLVLRTKGYWYSTLDIGEGSTWKLVETQKTISHACQYKHIHSVIEKRGRTCFSECPQPRTHLQIASSPAL